MKQWSVREEDGIQCLVCGRWFRALSTHVIRAHGYGSSHDYREEFGLSKRGLTCLSLERRQSSQAKETGLSDKGTKTRITQQIKNPKLSPEGRAVANENLIQGYLPALHATHERRRSATHCKHGHPYSTENTYIFNGHRKCRECGKAQKKLQNRRKKGLAPTKHGLHGYRTYACRCEICRAAQADAHQRWRLTRLSKAERPPK